MLSSKGMGQSGPAVDADAFGSPAGKDGQKRKGRRLASPLNIIMIVA
ncbi:MAG: hypothetical protein ACK2U5_06805 [Candidatus Promineifilaceae bacterium]